MFAFRLVTTLVAVGFCTLGAFAADFSNTVLKGRTDKENPVGYVAGEEIVFTVTASGLPVETEGCFYDWTRTGDDGAVETGRVAVSSAPLVVKTSLAKPGFVRLEVRVCDVDGKPVKGKDAFFDGGAGVEIEKLEPGEPEPVDFDAFWARQMRRLADVPMAARRKEIPCKNPKVTLYEVEVDCAGPRPVTGYLAIPKAASAACPVMAHLQFCGYGANLPAPINPQADRVTFHVNAHGVSLGRDKAYYDGFLDGIRTKGYSYAFSPYQNEHPEGSYFCGMALRAVRAAQYLFSLPEVQGKPHWICGGSQGGLQTMWAAAFETGATVAYPHITWCCDLGGFRLGRLQAPWRIPPVPALGYFDAVNFAKRAKVPVHITLAGLGDYTCPPSGLAVCYNALKVEKSIVWHQGSQHCYVPTKPNQTWTVKSK